MFSQLAAGARPDSPSPALNGGFSYEKIMVFIRKIVDFPVKNRGFSMKNGLTILLVLGQLHSMLIIATLG